MLDMTTQVSTIAASSQAIAEKTTGLMSTLDSPQTVITDHRASFFLKNTSVEEVEVSKDTPNSSVKPSSSQPTKKLSAIPISTSRAQSYRPNLPFVKIIHAPSVLGRSLIYDVEDTCLNGIAVELSMMQCVDNSTQTDTLRNKGPIFLTNKVAEQLGVNVEVKREHKNQKENRKQNSMLNEICEENDGVLAIALDRKNENGIEKNLGEDENYMLFSEIDFLDMKSVRSRGNEATSEIKSPIGCDNFSKKPISVLEIEQSSINSDNIIECKTQSSSESFLESVECTCNAVTQFNCDCEQTLANCTYQERIIDYDNFRIIEHVIDCAHESYCKHGEKMKCDTSCKETEEQNIEKNKEINLSCRELVAFIGESYQIINNEHQSMMQNQEQIDKHISVESPLMLDTHHSSNDEDIYCSSDADDIMGSQFTNTNLDENLDNNNNKGQSKGVAQSFNGTKNQSPESNKQAIGTTNSVSIEPSKRRKQQTISTIQNSTPSMALALKALKSKLTPLAPSFHPARIKSQSTSSTTNASSSMYAYEQTAICYQQEPQLPKSQLPCLQQSATTTTVQKMNLHQYPQLQEEQQYQLQVVPMVQSSYSKSYFQRQHNPSSLQNLQQAHHFSISSNEHSHHGDGLATLPQTHLNSSLSATTAAIPSSTLPMAAANPTQQAQLYPVQLISMATPTLAVDASNSIGQRQQACTTSTVVATVGNGSTPWPLLEATPVFIDSHGEFHTFCPTHGHAALNTVSVETVASPQCVPFNQTTLSSTRRNISQSSHSKHFQNPLQHQTPVASTKINSSNHLMVQNAKVNNQNHQSRHQQHPQQHQLHYHQQQQKLDSDFIPNISGKGKLYGGK